MLISLLPFICSPTGFEPKKSYHYLGYSLLRLNESSPIIDHHYTSHSHYNYDPLRLFFCCSSSSTTKGYTDICPFGINQYSFQYSNSFIQSDRRPVSVSYQFKSNQIKSQQQNREYKIVHNPQQIR